jgi:hypothetical protein
MVDAKLKFVDPVQLVYEHHPSNYYPHWMVMAERTYNDEYYKDVFRTYTWASERRQWLVENIGTGGRSAGQYPSQTWFIHEHSNQCAVCFRYENHALHFKLRWAT